MAGDAAWEQQFQEWYERLDAFIKTEEADKSAKDPTAWAAQVNRDVIAPLRTFFRARFADALPIKIEDLAVSKGGLFSKGTTRDDLLKRVKALRYAMYEYQKKTYLENAGDL